MKRSEINTNQDKEKLAVYANELMSRMSLAARLGFSFGGSRNLYETLGYPTEIEIPDYFARYLRHDIAAAVIDKPADKTWEGNLILEESKEADDTDFEEEWEHLDRTLHIKSMFLRIDKLSGIGQYGILFLGLDDVQNKDQLSTPVKSGKRKLKYIRPFGQNNVTIKTFVQDTKSERFGMPEIYTVKFTADVSNSTIQVIEADVHHSRVIHIPSEALTSDIFGIPRMQKVWNRLMDLEKLVGGSAEMYWKGARPGYTSKVDENYTVTNDTKVDLKNQIDEYEHGLRRFLVNEGLDLKALETQISDPESHVNVQLKMISAEKNIPVRVLVGSERGELASSQDSEEWKAHIKSRRESYAEGTIIRPFVDRCIEYGILPAPTTENKEYTVKWSDLYALSEQAKVDIGSKRTTALRDYAMYPIAQAMISPRAFFEFCMGFDSSQISLIKEMADKDINDEMDSMKQLQSDLFDTAVESTDTEGQKNTGSAQPNPKASSKIKPIKKV